MSGEVIGMNTFKVTNAENVNFAIATSEIINFLDDIAIRDNIKPTKVESAIELRDEEILDILDKAQESFFHITHSFTDWSGNGLLHKEYDSPEKLQYYLKQYWTSTAIKSFIKFIDAKYIDNRYCITIGDGVREDILHGKILKKQRIKDIIYITLSVYDLNSQQPNIENYEIKFEDGKWLVDHFDSQYGKIGDK